MNTSSRLPTSRRILLLLGTDHHRFDRAVAWADRWQDEHPEDLVMVQHGLTPGPTTAQGVAFWTPTELAEQVAQSDVVITHGGSGTTSNVRSWGHLPIIVARDPRFGEHIDDHQQRFAHWALGRGLAQAAPTVEELDAVLDGLPSSGTRAESELARAQAETTARIRSLVEAPDDRGRAAAPGAPTVLYIAGSGRSGSTLLECLVARLPGVVALGEVGHLWERALRDDELCACGQPFHACPFWTAVGERAFGGWDQVDLAEILSLKASVDRQRHTLTSARRHPGAQHRREILTYASYYRRIFAAARDESGAQVVVDSSKVAPTALAYSHDRGVDLRVLHIVRDSRAVAYSWSRSVARPEAGGELMPRMSPTESTVWWLSHNSGVAALAYRGVPTTRIRYEDLVRDPGPVVARAWRELRLPGRGELPLEGPRTIDLQTTHSVAGNPMRFRHGRTELRADDEWQRAMSPVHRRLVTAMSLPHLAAYGYLRRRS